MTPRRTASPGVSAPRGRYLATLSLTALGVVYGDIGTSPLYALRECFFGEHGVPATPGNVLGVLSLIFWSLTIIISLKYIVFVMRADNRGEGGILALMSLLRPPRERLRGGRWLLVILGIFGAALLYGDGMITPAISVLSAVEGLQIAAPAFGHVVVPLTIVVLLALFAFQRRGTAGVGAVFGPVMLLWFGTIAALGAVEIVARPGVLAAIGPAHALAFFRNNHGRGFLTLGAVFLVVTGGEALYADMGHFGTRPIRIAWFALVLPALLLNYFGQGAVLLGNPAAAHNPFYRLAPSWALYPMVVLSTVATVIASQAVISGAFSLTRQAILLGYSPRLRIEHTSAREIGQIYIPGVNTVLMLATIGLVIGFQTSSNLAAAYGVAVTTTMVITTILLCVVAREVWGWGKGKALLMAGAFFWIDAAFFGANIIKVEQGGWFPLVVAILVFTLLTTWRRGRIILNRRLADDTLPVDVFLADVARHSIARVAGTAVFMSRTPSGVPITLLHNLKHNKVLHRRVVFLTVATEESPYVPPGERFSVEDLGQGFYRILIRYGFMQDADVPSVLSKVEFAGLEFPPGDTTYFLGKETVLATAQPGMALWRERLFAVMSRNAGSATTFFRLPPNRVVELGAQIEI